MKPQNPPEEDRNLAATGQGNDQNAQNVERVSAEAEGPGLNEGEREEDADKKRQADQQSSPTATDGRQRPGTLHVEGGHHTQGVAKPRRLETILTFSTLILAVSTVGLWLTTRTANEAADEAAHAANILATNSLEVTEAQLIPTIFPTYDVPTSFGKGAPLVFKFLNGSAMDVSGTLRVSAAAVADDFELDFHHDLDKVTDVNIHAQRADTYTFELDEDDTSSEDNSYQAAVEALTPQQPNLIVFGDFHYKNDIGGERLVHFCKAVLSAQQDLPHKVRDCNVWNDEVLLKRADPLEVDGSGYIPRPLDFGVQHGSLKSLLTTTTVRCEDFKKLPNGSWYTKSSHVVVDGSDTQLIDQELEPRFININGRDLFFVIETACRSPYQR